jgi:hypothetical protein
MTQQQTKADSTPQKNNTSTYSVANRIAFFNALRTYVAQEDANVSNRMSWIISFNTVLIPSYAAMSALVFYMIKENVVVEYISFLMTLAIIVCLLCIMVCVFCASSLQGASKTVSSLERYWRSISDTSFENYPNITYGFNRHDKISSYHYVYPKTLCYIFLLVWSFILCFTMTLWIDYLPDIQKRLSENGDVHAQVSTTKVVEKNSKKYVKATVDKKQKLK